MDPVHSSGRHFRISAGKSIQKNIHAIKTNTIRQVYITSFGLYEAQLNGKKIGDQLFTPGWTSYNKRLQYQTYDVTELLVSGNNAIGVSIGDGWFRGNIGWINQRNFYGDKLTLLAQLEIEYKDGTVEMIHSDDSWTSSTGPILSSDIYNGEVYNAQLEQDWTTPEFVDNKWEKIKR